MSKGFTHESTYNESVEWYTPPEIFKALGVKFDLDPCSPPGGLEWVPAKKIISLPDNGLELPWEGLVWMNPPYGANTGKWMKKFIEHGNGIALVFSRTDTNWFHEYAVKADALCFIRHRIRFLRPDGEIGGTPGAGSLLVGCGTTASVTLTNSNLGWVTYPKMGFKNG
jgi:DNA N-6-adenine-methyltransferase Dam